MQKKNVVIFGLTWFSPFEWNYRHNKHNNIELSPLYHISPSHRLYSIINLHLCKLNRHSGHELIYFIFNFKQQSASWYVHNVCSAHDVFCTVSLRPSEASEFVLWFLCSSRCSLCSFLCSCFKSLFVILSSFFWP